MSHLYTREYNLALASLEADILFAGSREGNTKPWGYLRLKLTSQGLESSLVFPLIILYLSPLGTLFNSSAPTFSLKGFYTSFIYSVFYI